MGLGEHQAKGALKIVHDYSLQGADEALEKLVQNNAEDFPEDDSLPSIEELQKQAAALKQEPSGQLLEVTICVTDKQEEFLREVQRRVKGDQDDLSNAIALLLNQCCHRSTRTHENLMNSHD